MEDLLGLVTTGVCGEGAEGIAERAASRDRLTLPRPRRDVRDVLGSELNEDISSD